MSLEANLPWYFVHTKARQERTACDNLASQGYAVYLPRVRILERSRGRQQAKQEPLYPRYLFVQPASTVHAIAPARSTLGVTAIVRFGQKPAFMRPEAMESLQRGSPRRNQPLSAR